MNAVSQKEQAALTLPQRAAVALGAAEHEVKLRELVKSSADIVAVIDPAGREQAHRIGMTLKSARVAIEKTGKTAREDATAFSKAIIAEEKRLVDIVTGEEARVFSLRDEFDAKIEAESQAKIAIERQRVEGIQADIQRIRDLPTTLVLKPSADIAAAIDALRTEAVTTERFAEFIEAAQLAIDEADYNLVQMHGAKVGAEAAAIAAEEARKAEAARIEAERAELARQRAENERIANEQAAERKRLSDLAAAQEAAAKARRDLAAANLRAEQEAHAKRIAAEQAERDRVAAEVKAKLDALQAQIAADRKALEDERAAAAAKVEADAAAVELAKAQAVQAEEDRVRLQSMVDVAVVDARAPAPEIEALLDAAADDLDPSDDEISALAIDFGMTVPEWVERLSLYVTAMQAVMA